MDKATNKAVVFDWNCTLLDDIQAMLTCQNITMERLGRPPITMEFFCNYYEVPFERLYKNLGLSESEIEQAMGFDAHVFHDHYEPLAAQAALREGAADVLGFMHEHKVKSYILSNHIVEPIREQLKRLSVEHLFDEVLAYADRATQFRDMTKGERLRRFLRDKDESKNKIIIVGDSVEEIDIAREQGFVSVAITGGCVSEQRLRAQNPDYIVHSLHEIKPILQEQGFAS